MSIDAGAQVVIILLVYGPCVVIVNLLGQVCTLGRAPRTKETLPDFCEWCRVTRHSRIFHRLTGCQRDTPVLGRHRIDVKKNDNNTNLDEIHLNFQSSSLFFSLFLNFILGNILKTEPVIESKNLSIQDSSIIPMVKIKYNLYIF